MRITPACNREWCERSIGAMIRGGSMKVKLRRREFIKIASAVSAISTGTIAGAAPASLPVVISSANGLQATAKAMEIMKNGGKPLDGVIAGVNIVEDDPKDMSVGYGGLPNEEGEVELDASVMDGLTCGCGAV